MHYQEGNEHLDLRSNLFKETLIPNPLHEPEVAITRSRVKKIQEAFTLHFKG